MALKDPLDGTGFTGTIRNLTVVDTLNVTGTLNVAGVGVAAPQFEQVAPHGLVNSSNTTFHIPRQPVAGSLMIFDDGVLVPFTLSGQTVTLGQTPATGSVMVARFMVDKAATPVVLELTQPAAATPGASVQIVDSAYSYRLYIPSTFSSTRPAVVSYFGTDETMAGEMGPGSLHDYGGDSTWVQLAEKWGFAVIVPDVQFAAGVAATQYNKQQDIFATNLILDDLQTKGWIASGKHYITGHSSGGSLAWIHAFAFPARFSDLVLRHGVGMTASPDTTANLLATMDFNCGLGSGNGMPNINYNPGDVFGSPAVNGLTQNWRTDADGKLLETLVINGSTDPVIGGVAQNPGYASLANSLNTAILTLSGFLSANFVHKIFTAPDPAVGDPQVCPIMGDTWPHWCHSEDRALAAEWFFGNKDAFRS